MRYFQWLVQLLLLFTVPSIALYPHSVSEEYALLQIDSSLSYDDILELINHLETGELEKRCSEADLTKLNHFLAHLAVQGILPGEIEEEFNLKSDIQELLYEDDYSFVPAVFYNHGELIFCKSWIHKKWDQAKKFVKKHKKALIIGAAVVVAAAVVVGVVVAASTAGAVAAGAAASESEDKDRPNSHDEQESISSSLQSAIEEQVTSFKETIVNEQFFQPSSQGEFSLGEEGKVVTPLLAHDIFKNLARHFDYEPLPISKEFDISSRDFGHHEIDRQFSTDYATLYTDPTKESDFNTLANQVQGERALAIGDFKQAVHNLGRSIDLNPTNPLPYLERAVAQFGLGEFDRSLEDYHHYVSQTPKKESLSIADFSFGFAKGLPTGIYESGEGLFLFLADLVKHPIHTGEQIWNALTLLRDLAHSEQWDTLGKILVPEAHQLITEWDSLPSDVRGELAGRVFGKYGSDIIIPGALTKAIAKQLQRAQELSAVCKSLHIAEQTLLLESAAGWGSGAKAGEVLRANHHTLNLANELGFPIHEMSQLKQAGNLEAAVAHTFESISKNPAMIESIAMHKNAKAFLKPYMKKPMPEGQVRDLIYKAGIPTFQKPQGIPENFLAMISDKGAGMLYVHPENAHISIRIMPGKSHSPFPYQQKPYVIQMDNGKAIDKFGKRISADMPEAHIPLEEFVYRN